MFIKSLRPLAVRGFATSAVVRTRVGTEVVGFTGAIGNTPLVRQRVSYCS